MRNNPFVVGLITFFASMIVLGLLVGPAACTDGWSSPSIGRQGACSWHGGVNHLPEFLVLLGSIALGFGASHIAGMFSKKSTVSPRTPPGTDDKTKMSLDQHPHCFAIGDDVYHPQFGYGRVVRKEGSDDGERLFLKFGSTVREFSSKAAMNAGLRLLSLAEKLSRV